MADKFDVGDVIRMKNLIRVAVMSGKSCVSEQISVKVRDVVIRSWFQENWLKKIPGKLQKKLETKTFLWYHVKL